MPVPVDDPASSGLPPLAIIAGILRPGTDAETDPWHEATYRGSMTARIALIDRYEPASVDPSLVLGTMKA